MAIKVFNNCVNKSSPEYQKLTKDLSDIDAELVVRLNGMEIPSPSKAEEILREHRNKSYSDFIDYVKNSEIIDYVGLRKNLSGLINPWKKDVTLVKSSLTEIANNDISGDKQYKQVQSKYNADVFNSNVRALETIRRKLEQEGLPDLFTIKSRTDGPGAYVVFNRRAIDSVNKKNIEYMDDYIDYANEKVGDTVNDQIAFREQVAPLFSLKTIEDQPEERREEFERNLRRWVFTPEFDEQAQSNIINTLTGRTYNDMIKHVIGQKDAKIKILSPDRNGVSGQLNVKRLLQDKLAELMSESDISIQDEELKRKLEILLRDEVWNKYQQAVLTNIQSFGYKFTNEPGIVVGSDFGDSKELDEAVEDIPDDTADMGEITGQEGEAGKGQSYNDMASVMLNLKDNMSSRAKVWLSAFPSNSRSFIAIDSFKGLPFKGESTYIDLNKMDHDISEATLGKLTKEAMLAGLREASSKLPNREHLALVADRLEKEFEKGNKIANEIFTVYNRTRNELLMVKFDLTPRKFSVGTETLYELDKDKNPIFDLGVKVMNVNRNDVPSNIRENWLAQFNLAFNINSGVNEDGYGTGIEYDKGEVKKVYADYISIKNSILQYFKEGGMINEEHRDTVREMLRKLFKDIGIDINNPVLDYLIDGKNVNNKFVAKKNQSIFHPTKGYLGSIFEEFKENGDPIKAFNSSGMKFMSQRMAKYTDSFLNSSTRDEKGRNIWAYGLNDAFTRGYWDFMNSAQDLQKIRDMIAEGADIQETSYIQDLLQLDYNKQSKILNWLSTIQGDDLNVFLNNFKYSIFNVTKASMRGSNPKELSDSNDREFINTKLMLFSNRIFSTDITGEKQYWSYKFLTTPSDKTKMYTLQTPDHNSRINIEGSSVRVLSKTVDEFFNYFLGEYNSIKSYLNGDEEFRKAFDAITTTDPKIFYNFGQFNIKSSILWEKGQDGNYTLRDINDPEVEQFIKEKIQEQIEQDIQKTFSNFYDLGLIEDDKLITGVNSSYAYSLPNAISKLENLDRIAKDIETLRKDDKTPEDVKGAREIGLLNEYKALRDESDKRLAKFLIADYAINMHLHNLEMEMTFVGDPRRFLKDAKMKTTWEQFNGATVVNKSGLPMSWSDVTTWTIHLNNIRDNMSKRMAGLQGPGTQGITTEDKPTTNSIALQDGKVSSKIVDEISKEFPELTARFQEVPTLDGEEYITAEEHLTILKSTGKIGEEEYNKYLEKVNAGFEDLITKGEVSPENYIDEFVAQIQKPVIFGDVPDKYLKSMTTVYIKPSSVALYPQVIQNTELGKLAVSVYKHNKKGGRRIDRMPVVSAQKVGAINPIKGVFNPDMSINEEALKDISEDRIQETPRKLFRIQQEVPYDPEHTSVRVSTQQVKLLFNEISDLEFEASKIGHDKLTGEQLKELHNKLYQASFDIQYHGFLMKTGAEYNSETQKYQYNSLEKLQKVLIEHALSNKMDINELDGLELTADKEEFVVPLAFASDPTSYERLLLSLINRVILQKINGRSFIMASEQGIKPTKKPELITGSKVDDWINFNKTNIVWVKDSFNPEKGLLPQRPHEANNNKVLPGQIIITWNFKDSNGETLKLDDFIVKENGHKFLDVSRIDDDLRALIGFRIPNQGFPSMTSLEMVGFIDPMMGDMVVSSQDLTTIMGADFDIDKLYSYMYNYYYGHEDSPELDELNSKMEALLGDLQDEKYKQFGEYASFINQYKNKIRSKYSTDPESDFMSYITNSILTRNQEMNQKYDYGFSSGEVLEFLDSLSEDQIKQINKATYTPSKKSKLSLEDLFSGEDLRMAQSLKNHIGFYNSTFKEAVEVDATKAEEYQEIIAEKIGKDKEFRELKQARNSARGKKKLKKINTDFENIENNDIKQLQNGMQDIHHTILTDKKVWERMLQGINEGNLADLSSKIKSLRAVNDTDIPSMGSDRYKNEEYMSNRGSKLGVGIFSIGNTFFTVIEGKDLFLSRRTTKGDIVPDPLVIKDPAGNEYSFSNLSGSRGHNKLISIFQSAALDDAKLKIMKAINENKYTMGITVVLAGLANDNIKDGKEPLLSTDFIVNFLSQPIIVDYVSKLSTGNDDLSDYDKDWKENIAASLRAEYIVGEEDPDNMDWPGSFSLKELEAAIYHEQEFKQSGDIKLTSDGFDGSKYRNLQLAVFSQFIKLEKAADLVRQGQYLINTDSKGVPKSIQEALFKKTMKENLFNSPPGNIANFLKIFNTDGTQSSPKTLQGYLGDLGVNTPIDLFNGTEETGSILPFASFSYRSFLSELNELRGINSEVFFNAKLANQVWNAFLSNMWSNPMLGIADAPLFYERFFLIKESESNKSLATQVEEFMSSSQYINNPLLRPLFNSLQMRSNKKDSQFRFVEFRGSVGLSVDKKEISLALFLLRNLNYPLFENIIKYSLLVSPPNAPTSLRRFIPNIYLNAIGVTDRMRMLNRSLNSDVPEQNISVNPYLPVVRPLHQMVFQHNPELAFRFNKAEVDAVASGNIFYISQDKNSNFFRITYTDIEGDLRPVYTPYPFVSTINNKSKEFELYKLVEFNRMGDSHYARIPLLGSFNLNEYDPSYTKEEPKQSILESNNVGFKYAPVNSFSVVDSDLPSSMEEITGYSGAAYGADFFWDQLGRQEGIKFTHFRPGEQAIPKIFKESLSNEDLEESIKLLTPKLLEGGYRILEDMLGETVPRNSSNDLKARSYFQIQNATAIFAVGKLASPVRVEGGTNTAISIAKRFKKPIFIWDTGSQKWHRWNGNRFVESETIPYLPKNFAAIGTRKIQNYPFKDESGQWLDKHPSYLGIDKENAAKQAMLQVIMKTKGIINGDALPYSQELSAEQPTPVTETQVDIPKVTNSNHLSSKYDYNSSMSGEENVSNILKKIATRSDNASYRILAKILLEVAQAQGSLKDINLELTNVNEYQNNNLRINAEIKSETFEKVFQYNFLHELVHHYLISKLDDGSTIGNVLSANIDRMILELEKPENLQKAIDRFKLKSTVEQLQAKLARLRADAGKSEADGPATRFSSEAERAVLNPLINKHEFASTLLNDNDTQSWTNDIPYEGERQNIFSKFLDLLKGMFNNFLRSLGIKISDKTDTILKSGIRTIMQAFGRKPVGQENSLEDLQPNHDAYISMNGFDTGKIKKSPLLWMPKNAKLRADIQAETLIGAVIEGKRTSTSRNIGQIRSIKLRVGGTDKDGKPLGNPYVWLRDDYDTDKREVLVKITKIHNLSNGERKLTPEQWSSVEGWDPAYAIEKPEVLSNKMYQVDFEYVSPEVKIDPQDTENKDNDKKEKPGDQLDLFAKLTSIEDSEEEINDAEELPKSEDEQANERAIKFVRESLYTHFTTRFHSLNNSLTALNKNKSLSPQQRKDKADELLKSINIVASNITKIEEEFDIATFMDVAKKDIQRIKDILADRNPSTSKIYESVQTMATYEQVYSDLIKKYVDSYPDMVFAKEADGIFASVKSSGGDLNQLFNKLKVPVESRPLLESFDLSTGTIDSFRRLYKDKIEPPAIDPVLLNSLRSAKAEVSGLKRDVDSAVLSAVQRVAYDHTGKMFDYNDLFYGLESSHFFRANMLNMSQSSNNLTNVTGKILSDMNLGLKAATTHLTNKIAEERKQFKDAGFNDSDIINVKTSIDQVTGLPKVVKSFKTRYNQEIWDNIWKSINSFKGDISAKKSRSNRILRDNFYHVDVRYLYPREFNSEMNQELLNEESSERDYIRNFTDFTKEQFGEFYGDTHTKLVSEAIQSAKDKFEAYKTSKIRAFDLIDEEEQDDAIASLRKQDWLAFNSPFHILNERYGLSSAATFWGNDPAFKSHAPKISEVDAQGRAKFVPWNKVNPITGKIQRVRIADRYLTMKGRNTTRTGNPTGLVDKNYAVMEKEFFEKALPDIEYNREREIEGSKDLKEVQPTKLDYLNWQLKTQSDLLSLFPNYLTKDLKWFEMLDIGKTLEEELHNASLFYKFKLYPQLVWDNVVSTVSTPLLQSRLNQIDLITKEVNRSFKLTPAFLGSKMDDKGLGEFKTSDLTHYTDVLLKSAIEFSFKSDIEESVKLIQYLWTTGQLTNPGEIDKKTGELKDGVAFNPGVDKKLFDWSINRIIYNEPRDLFFNEEKSERFKRGELDKKDLHNSDTKIFGVLAAKYKLTKMERDKLDAINKQLDTIYPKIEALANAVTPEDLGKKADLVNRAISLRKDRDRIARVSTPVTKYETYRTYLRIKFMGWGVTGRAMDTYHSGILNNILEGLDGRLFKVGDFMKSFAAMSYISGFKYIGSAAATYSALHYVGKPIFESFAGNSHIIQGFLTAFPDAKPAFELAVASFGIHYGIGWISKYIRNQRAKMEQLTIHFGAEDAFEARDNEEKGTKSILSKKLKPFAPMGLVAMGESFNKSLTVRAFLNATKIRDLSGKERSLIDAYILNPKGRLVWNEEEFGTEESHKMEMYGHNSKMVELRNKLEAAIRHPHGDYSSVLPKLVDKGIGILNILTFLRKYIGELAMLQIGGEWYDSQSGLMNIGSMRSLPAAVGKKIKGQTVPDHYKAALRRLAGTLVLIGGTFAAYLALSNYIRDKSVAQSNGQKIDEGLYQLENLVNRSWQEQTQVINPEVFQARSITGITPDLANISNFLDVMKSIEKGFYNPQHPGEPFWKNDKMTPQELHINKLMPANDVLFQFNEPYYNSWYQDVQEKPNILYLNYTGSAHDKYPKINIDDSYSRTLFKTMKLLPGFSTWRSQENLKKSNNLSKPVN